MVQKRSLCIVGLGYVGLPLAHAFAKAGHTVYGYDISKTRIEQLQKGFDRTLEISEESLKSVQIEYTTDPSVIAKAEVIIVLMPTPVDEDNKPDLTLVENATQVVGRYIKKGAIVVYESTVYPGVTEEICGPILERESGMKCGVDFFLGYSPERINPGDKLHTIDKITKIVSGQDEKTAATLVDLYGSIITAGIHRAPSIKVAEMAKAIENAQRDLNIAFVNEVAVLCHKIGIPTTAVLDAAGTKWNFLPFKPGLVGGHCIGVDPYYLVEKARQLGMQTHVITAGRVINEGMGNIVAHEVMEAIKTPPADARILVLGLTFKENMPDTRNSKSRDVVLHFTSSGYRVQVHDPYLTTDGIRGQDMEPGSLEDGPYDAVLLLVPHKEYLAIPLETLLSSIKKGGVVYDLKSSLDADAIRAAGYTYQAL